MDKRVKSNKNSKKALAKILWSREVVPLKELVLGKNNPRQTSVEQERLIRESIERFGQVQVIVAGPDGKIYDGNQRYLVLLNIYGGDYEVNIRRSSRALSASEQKRLVYLLHAGAVGSWDFNELDGWGDELLNKNGMGEQRIGEINADISAILSMLNAGDLLYKPNVDPKYSGYRELDNYDVLRAEEKQRKLATDDKKLEKIICQECGKEFSIHVKS